MALRNDWKIITYNQGFKKRSEAEIAPTTKRYRSSPKRHRDNCGRISRIYLQFFKILRIATKPQPQFKTLLTICRVTELQLIESQVVVGGIMIFGISGFPTIF